MTEAKEKPKAEPKAPAKCGHENLHHEWATKEKVTCILPKGHEGDHFSDKIESQPEDKGPWKAYWSDAAGLPLPDPLVVEQEYIAARELERKQMLASLNA